MVPPLLHISQAHHFAALPSVSCHTRCGAQDPLSRMLLLRSCSAAVNWRIAAIGPGPEQVLAQIAVAANQVGLKAVRRQCRAVSSVSNSLGAPKNLC